MGSLYVKGTKLWARYKDEHGVWKGAPTPYRPGGTSLLRACLHGQSHWICRGSGPDVENGGWRQTLASDAQRTTGGLRSVLF